MMWTAVLGAITWIAFLVACLTRVVLAERSAGTGGADERTPLPRRSAAVRRLDVAIAFLTVACLASLFGHFFQVLSDVAS
ncbi:hypothetical protein [Georgenia alba]|uniref:DUF1467 family protein n=1 Tax=Georgenia alba TaxID=2233858 RepID=A0ABW2Q938_9MICO